MKTNLNAKIISFNNDNIKICASAARISTTKGSSLELLELEKSDKDNESLIQRVLRSGHKSFIEHATFTIAFCNVSAIVEQFLIEFRLASFTVKSRRYVDFSNMGYYVPSGMDAKSLSIYTNHTDFLFNEYNYLLDCGIPKEDARFILPYSFYSNFYCTLNARELVNILKQIRFGRGSEIPELTEISEQLISQLETIFPILLDELSDNHVKCEHKTFACNHKQDAAHSIGEVQLLSKETNAESILLLGHLISNGIAPGDCEFSNYDAEAVNEIIRDIIKSERPRELEQLHYTFLLKGITLSGLTHLARHRIQSVIIPSLLNIDASYYITPQSVLDNRSICERYITVFDKTIGIYKELQSNGLAKHQLAYLLLSGNLIDVMTTMNARELLLFLQLRTCNRAQWEIRDLSIKMLELLRAEFPLVFNNIGPSCYVKGYCPEGKLSCNRMSEVKKQFNEKA